VTTLAVADVKALTGQITMLAEYFNYELEPHVLRLYVDGLRDVPHEALRAGCRRIIATATFMPKVAEIRRAIDDARPTTDIREAFADAGRICTRCDDSGWVIVAERTDRAQPTARRCACYTTNPRLVQPKRFSEDNTR
jgi:hypothetical protein